MQNKLNWKHRIAVAMGKEPADIVFVNGKIVSTFTEEILETEVAVSDGKIVSLGYDGEARERIDLRGAYLSPSFMDAHIHIESSMLSPEGFAEAVVPRGTGVVISDPHEIVNVWGVKGFRYMVEASQNIPLDIFYTIPSCVPATHMETSGAMIQAKDIEELYHFYPQTPALSEMMNYPGVYLGSDDVLDKIITARNLGLPIDGHSPMLGGKYLNAYLNAEISTDHECTTLEEAQEKLRRGMFVLIREGSAARNLKSLLPLIQDNTVHRICMSSDDRHPDDLIEKGHLDYTLRQLIENGIHPARAIRLMTLNPALLYGLKGRGGIAPGYLADMVVLDRLDRPEVKAVYKKGIQVSEQGNLIQKISRKQDGISSSVELPPELGKKLRSFPSQGQVRIIGIMENQILTEHLTGLVEDIVEKDMAYLAVVERHGKSGQVGLSFVKGLGLREGCLASTVAHDSHNLILAGKSLDDMEAAAHFIKEMGGGFAVVKNRKLIASVPLPVGGLMSLKTVEEVAADLRKLNDAVVALGVSLRSPFMYLSFLALPVIPHLKLTDRGLVDVDRFETVSLTISK